MHLMGCNTFSSYIIIKSSKSNQAKLLGFLFQVAVLCHPETKLFPFMKLDPAGTEAVEGAEAVVPASGLTPARPMMDAIGQVPGRI